MCWKKPPRPRARAFSFILANARGDGGVVRHYTDRLFSFRVMRPQAFRFRSGEFVMIGLPNAEKKKSPRQAWIARRFL